MLQLQTQPGRNMICKLCARRTAWCYGTPTDAVAHHALLSNDDWISAGITAAHRSIQEGDSSHARVLRVGMPAKHVSRQQLPCSSKGSPAKREGLHARFGCQVHRPCLTCRGSDSACWAMCSMWQKCITLICMYRACLMLVECGSCQLLGCCASKSGSLAS